jgi:hypothetical protein
LKKKPQTKAAAPKAAAKKTPARTSTPKKPATPKRTTTGGIDGLMQGLADSLAKRKKPAGADGVVANAHGTVMPPPPAPAPAPPAQEWRKTIDWAAAGRKAYETRLRNAALKAGGQMPTAPPPKPTAVKMPARPAAAPAPAPAPAPAVTEEHTSRRSPTLSNGTRLTVASRRSTTSRSSAARK